MFYAHFVLAKKGPLARIWLAAHWDKKLTKAHVFETNINTTVEDILHPKVKLALRTSGHLLLGVVRIYSRKAKYLLADCNEAFIKIKMAFRPGMVDLPEENREAAVNAITLPEVFHDFDANIPDLNDVDIQAQFTVNQSRAEEITMREDYGSLTFASTDDGFGDMGFGSEPAEMLRDAGHINASLEPGLLFGEPLDKTKERESRLSVRATTSALEIDAPIRDDGFGGHLGQDMISGGLFEGGLFDDVPMAENDGLEGDKKRKRADSNADSDDDGIDHFGAPPSPGAASSISSRPGSPLNRDGAMSPDELKPPPLSEASRDHKDNEIFNPVDEGSQPPDQTTLLHNEDESFALAPVDASALKGWNTRTKRKRKLIVDEVKNISGEEMKSQLSDTSDIVTTLDLAPPTKRLMHWKETGGVEKLFALPGRPIPARSLFKNYQRHLISQGAENEDFGMMGDADRDHLTLEVMRGIDVPAPLAAPAEAETPEPVVAAVPVPPMAPPTPTPSKRAPRKRKAPVDVEEQQRRAEQDALEHVQQREAQYQRLLAPSPIPQQLPPPPPVATPSMIDMSMNASMTPVPMPLQIPEQQPEASFMLPFDQAPMSTPMPMPMPIQDQTLLPQPESVEMGAAHLQPHVPPPMTMPMPEMENMGYDQSTANATLLGFEEPHLPAQTPGALSERGAPTPWNEDYDFPPSVGPADEQGVDETYEQFEERVLNKRAAHMYHIIRSKLELKGTMTFSEIAARNNKKQIAQKFYTLLVLKKNQAVELVQHRSYDEIHVFRGNKFDSPAL